MIVIELTKAEEEGREPSTTFLVFLYLLLSVLLLSLEIAHIFRASLNFTNWSSPPYIVLPQGSFHQALMSLHVTRWFDEQQETSVFQDNEVRQQPITSQASHPPRPRQPSQTEESSQVNDKENERHACKENLKQTFPNEVDLNSQRDDKQLEPYKAIHYIEKKPHNCCFKELQDKTDSKQRQISEECNKRTHKPYLEFEGYIEESVLQYNERFKSQETQNHTSIHTKCRQRYSLARSNSPQTTR